MSNRDWDAEMRKIDRQLEGLADEQILPSRGAVSPAARADVLAAQQRTSTLPAVLRLSLATLLGVAILFWPYASRCGAGLAAYLFAVLAVIGGGVWSGIWTWRHRAARAHVLSLLLVLWGLVLALIEVLPRTGYAIPTPRHPAVWTCD